MDQARWQIGPVLPWLDLFGVAVFAASGALAATRRGQTLVTLTFFALVTGVGGGTVRDLLIGAPVFWVQDRLYARSEEHTSELQSLMRISYAVFCLTKKKQHNPTQKL